MNMRANMIVVLKIFSQNLTENSSAINMMNLKQMIEVCETFNIMCVNKKAHETIKWVFIGIRGVIIEILNLEAEKIKFIYTVIILNFQTGRSGKTV